MNEQKELIQKKANFFKERGIEVHIVLLNKRYLHGNIGDETDEFFILNSPVDGTIPVFFLEVKDIVPYKKKEERK